MDLLTKVKDFLYNGKIIRQNEQILVACSGGPDSLALLHILYNISDELGIKLAVAHVNHMLRGQQAQADAEFVGKFSQQLGLSSYITAIDVHTYAQDNGKSLEEAARIVRYAFLQQTAEKLGGAKIAVGHHRDDQAETLLQNLLRGSGSRGLRAMQPVTGNIIRPLLWVARQEIEQYCLIHSLNPRMDYSNLDENFTRNRIRLKLIPWLEQNFNENIKQGLARTANIISDEYDFLLSQTYKAWYQVARQKNNIIELDCEQVSKLHIAVQREIFRLAIEKIQDHIRGISFYHVEKLIKQNNGGKVGSILELPGGLIARKNYYTMELGFGLSKVNATVGLPGLELKVPSNTEIPCLNIRIELRLGGVDEIANCLSMAFDWQEIKPPVFLRTRLSGDRFQPLGMKNSKKLKDFFIDEKIPQLLRDQIPLLCDNQGILSVGSYRRSDRAKITEKTKTVLFVTLYNQEEIHDGKRHQRGIVYR